MKVHRFIIVMLTALVLVSAPGVRGDDLGTAFTYQGQLKRVGLPVSDTVDFEFELYDAQTGGSPVGPVVPVSAVDVANGLFTVQLDFGTDIFTGDRLWLEIAVKGSADPGFTTLDPRQEVTPSPYALYSDSTRGIFVDDQGSVGIGTTEPIAKLHI